MSRDNSFEYMQLLRAYCRDTLLDGTDKFVSLDTYLASVNYRLSPIPIVSHETNKNIITAKVLEANAKIGQNKREQKGSKSRQSKQKKGTKKRKQRSKRGKTKKKQKSKQIKTAKKNQHQN